jgi:hypothetical protein
MVVFIGGLVEERSFGVPAEEVLTERKSTISFPA